MDIKEDWSYDPCHSLLYYSSPVKIFCWFCFKSQTTMVFCSAALQQRKCRELYPEENSSGVKEMR